MIQLTDLEFAGLLAGLILGVLGVDMVVAKRNERRWAEQRRRLAIRAELRRHRDEEAR